jgi:hypothetical protein
MAAWTLQYNGRNDYKRNFLNSSDITSNFSHCTTFVSGDLVLLLLQWAETMFLYNWASNGPISVDLQKYHSQYVGMFMMSPYKERTPKKIFTQPPHWSTLFRENTFAKVAYFLIIYYYI